MAAEYLFSRKSVSIDFHSSHLEKSPRQKSKTMKKRMKFLEQSFGGSTDSQISNGCDSSSPVLLKKSMSADPTHLEEIQRLTEKLKQSEKVRHVVFSCILR